MTTYVQMDVSHRSVKGAPKSARSGAPRRLALVSCFATFERVERLRARNNAVPVNAAACVIRRSRYYTKEATGCEPS